MVRTLLAALALGLSLAAEPLAAKELKLAHFMSPQHPMDQHVMRPLAQVVTEATGGALTIKIYPAGELGSGPGQQYRRAVTGIADIAFNLPQYTPAQFKRSTLLHVPGLFSSPEQATEVIWENIDALQKDFDQVELLAFWTNNPMLLFTRGRAVRSLDDMKGLKIRVGDAVSARIIEAWGGVPVSMSAPETYNAMSTGVVDGVLIGASAVGSYKLQEVTDYVTGNLPSALSTFTLIMNRDAWNALSEEHKQLLREHTGKDLSLRAAAAFKAAGDKGLAALKDADVEQITLDAASRAALIEAMQAPVQAFLESEGKAAGFDGPALVDRFRTSE